MTLTIDDLRPVEKTLLITVTGRTLDVPTANPILGIAWPPRRLTSSSPAS
jgi:hypothetical protein